MINYGVLKPGQIVRYGPSLYRVDYVNECRALIIPLTKGELAKGVVKTESDPDSRGISISPSAHAEIIEDLEQERDRMELAELEAEIAATKAELAARDAPPPPPVTTVTLPKNRPPAPKTPRSSTTGGWILVDGKTPSFKEGTLAEEVWLFIGRNPGKTTAEIVAGVKSEGAVAACVSRFHQARIIEKR